MNIVFIGDSLTSGENNNFKSYVYYYKEHHPNDNIQSIGVSGSCFGNYSIYPVEENLLSMLFDNGDLIKEADKLYIEFITNDTTAVATGYVDIKKVYISIVRALDQIKQLNSDIEITFLVPFYVDNRIIYYSTSSHCMYLNFDYFSCFNIEVRKNDWINAYIDIFQFLDDVQGTNLLALDPEGNIFNNLELLDEDNFHPNDKGYKLIAENLSKIT